ncbi:DUF4229 domain-containing protein [Allosalinactinospora lopnorensis]|uniref:DUF4229 domain-containing protein n=1 Tax=Allosalinactinospora lopnorensis TaxID=1352348 RepID=UPI000623FD39|nr:DUF4229 domain-containing protein [Allosalinactinospora lopnorensis]
MRNVIAYTASRLLLFAVAFGVLYLLGARGALGLILAFVISGLASYILLSAQRDAVSSSLFTWLERRRGMGERLEAGAAKEDEPQEPREPGASGEDGERSAGDEDDRAGHALDAENAEESGSALRKQG